MQNGLHFISGLPRSGSTLLAAILRQNPRLHAGMSSPVGSLFMALQGAMSRRNEAAIFIDEMQKRELLKGIFDNYYHAVHPTKMVLDTNRAWCSKLPTLVKLFPEAKVICCVRHVPWIMDSLERLIRQNAFELSGIFNFESLNTVYTRVNRLATSDGLVGFAIDALREAFWGENASRLILVGYEALCKDPSGTLDQIYDFLGESRFAHDFENVEYEADDFDLGIGTPNLHKVRRKVSWLERETVLPPELFNRFANDAFWMIPELNTHNVPVISPRG
ncbi:sulfotransferase [Bradyrhizobium sp. CCBAU 11434]|uniref:Sulfotransferase n=1 Tax=Bradyrhizobium zhengyangense TaxID=2911009 RepID=A0ABS9M0J5_9BRAD|nr:MULTISPECIES: sulfotransferase [Bradyrhizobium]MCG2672786.1 sulfotransferase [Bradyrhizobium zhengyangense]MDA9521386.1 sulfotransferase [Bradyrhizobium sp. CCBAU 11434]